MSKIDQFESVFKAADKEIFQHQSITLKNILVISDGDEKVHAAYLAQLQQFAPLVKDVTWHHAKRNDYNNIKELMDLSHDISPDLVCTYRNLTTNAWQWPYSLGDYLDVLTQETNIPILVTPHPKKEGKEWPQTPLKTVMAVTDDLTGDDRLINYALRYTPAGGSLIIANIGDLAQFDRTIELISKIPDLDTEIARQEIHEQMLKEPRDFITSCQQVLEAEGHQVSIKSIVELGHFLSDYQKHIKEHDVDLLVLNTKDDDQLAMHGLAYPIAVEFRSIPLLML